MAARRSIPRASGKFMEAQKSKKSTRLGPPMDVDSVEPRVEMCTKLMAARRPVTSMVRRIMSVTMMGPQPAVPGRPSTGVGALSLEAKLNPSESNESPIDVDKE